MMDDPMSSELELPSSAMMGEPTSLGGEELLGSGADVDVDMSLSSQACWGNLGSGLTSVQEELFAYEPVSTASAVRGSACRATATRATATAVP